MARTLAEGLRAVEDPALSAAILDHALTDGDTVEICERMKKRNIPFVTYSGYDDLVGVCREGVHLNKPASMSVLVATVKGLLAERTQRPVEPAQSNLREHEIRRRAAASLERRCPIVGGPRAL